VGGKWLASGINVHGEFTGPAVNTFENQADGLREAMEKTGAKIETEPDEYPEVETLLAAFAEAMGIANTAILKHRKEG
jgi:hypothetical protein